MVGWLVAFSAVPMPLWGHSGSWICAGEQREKGSGMGELEGNKQDALLFSRGWQGPSVRKGGVRRETLLP